MASPTRNYYILAVFAGSLFGIAASSAYKIGSASSGSKHTNSAEVIRRADKIETVSQPLLRDEFHHRYKRYVNERSRHRKVLLWEVLAAYMRANPQECFQALREVNGYYLISGDSFSSIVGNIDHHDFTLASKMASETGGSLSDALIRNGFRRQIESHPEAAFGFVRTLPGHLREELSMELARSWGKRNGPEAAAAFLGYKGVSQWQINSTR